MTRTPPETITQAPSPPQPLGGVYTENFPALLEQLGISVLVTSHQANKLIVLRSGGTGRVDLHSWNLPKPAGLAADRTRLAVGTAQQVRQYRNLDPVPRRLEPPGRYDACYLARATHITGDLDVHEMAWAGDELWLVNTRFSCLCTLDGAHSFVPRWRPPFITALAAEDRCHLNGLALAADAHGGLTPRYVTALAATDGPQGWRAHKRDGGVLLSVPDGAVVGSGLSMPHSPRLHGGWLWVLESGAGGLGVVDPAAGRYQRVAELPGFTRGLDFVGNLAFVGLSQVRDSAVFGGLRVSELPPAERSSGVWVVDVGSGHTIAFVRFDDSVQEVFAVQVLAGLRYPELTHDTELLANAFDLPPAALEQLRTSSR